ncbi:MAG: hypothetical protein JW784_06785, partial [Candidatus Cloacimonetes bacterium]|nr:hypothetical protein [Candidatus Cloacimonadota bacterium]
MNKARRKGIIFLGMLAVLLIYILFLDSSSFLRRFEISYRLSKLQADLEFLKGENARLQSENQDL